MPYMPFLLPVWILGLLSIALLGGGVYLIWAWYVGVVVGTGYLVAGVVMTIVALFGRPIVLLWRRGVRAEPQSIRELQTHRLQRPDGTMLHVDLSGPPAA